MAINRPLDAMGAPYLNLTGFMKRPFSTRIRLLHNLMIQIFKCINTRTEIYAPEPVDGLGPGQGHINISV